MSKFHIFVAVFSPSSAYTPPGQDFFHKHKAALETRLGLLRPILSELETHRVLNPQEREEVERDKCFNGIVKKKSLVKYSPVQLNEFD